MSIRHLLLVALLLPCTFAAADDRDTVERFNDTLIRAMKSGGNFAERAAIIGPQVDVAFDVDTIARVSLGRTWRDLDDDGRARFVELLESLIVATYADRFDNFNEQRFETTGVEAPKTNRSVVKTRLVRVDADAVTLDYYLTNGRIYNIVADGVSDLSLRRADYAAIIARKGFDGLLADIRGKIAAYRDGGMDEAAQ